MFKMAVEDRYNVVTANSIDSLLDKIENETKKPAFINNWMDEDNVKEAVAYGTEWQNNEDEMPDADFKELAKEHIDSMFNDFRHDFRQKAEVRKGGLVGFRCMKVEVKKFLNALKKGKYQKGFSGVGKWFSWDNDAADCHWGDTKGEEVTVIAIIPFSSLDVKGMARANMDYSLGRDEKEITLKQGAKLKIEKILDSDGKNLLGDDIKELPAVAEI